MKIRWDDLQTVMTLVRGQSLAAAARELGLSYTTVARRISRAERDLGETLFERLADGYQPTEAARLVAEHAATMEQSEHALLRGLTGRDQDLSGGLTITAPQLLIAHVLAPVIDDFCDRYPDVTLSVRATNRPLDLNRREADLAIRISREPGDSLMGVRLAEQHSASFAAPELAERLRAAPEMTVPWVVYDQYKTVPRAVDPAYPNHRVRMVFDDMVAMLGAAQAGLGVVRAPMFLGRTWPGLVQVPVLPPQPYPDIWAVAHRDVWPSAKVTAFRNLLVPHIKARRADFLG